MDLTLAAREAFINALSTDENFKNEIAAVIAAQPELTLVQAMEAINEYLREAQEQYERDH